MAKHKPSKSSKAGKRPKSSGKSGAKGSKKKPNVTATKAHETEARAAYALAVNPKKDSQERQAALAMDPSAMCESPKTFAKILNVLRNPAEPIDVRLSALDAVAAARFSAYNFKSCRAD